VHWDQIKNSERRIVPTAGGAKRTRKAGSDHMAMATQTPENANPMPKSVALARARSIWNRFRSPLDGISLRLLMWLRNKKRAPFLEGP